MSTRMGRASGSDPVDRSVRDVELDLEVGTKLEGYRWVEWNHAAIAEAPLDEDGRFIGHPGDLLAHLYVEASPGTPLAEDAYARLPRYSLEPGPALRAAERAGLMEEEGIGLSCRADGVWRLSARRADLEMEDECLPRLVCRAALRVRSLRAAEEDR